MDLCEENGRKLLDFIVRKLHMMPGIYLHLCKTHTVRHVTYAISDNLDVNVCAGGKHLPFQLLDT